MNFKSSRKRVFVYLALILVSLVFMIPPAFSDQDTVYVIEVSGTVDAGMYTYIDRSIDEAEEKGAKAIILEIDTTGGLMDSAMSIKDRISGNKLPVMSFVKSRALSAGAYIALTGDKITMSSSSTMGAALPVTASADGNYTAAEYKIISAWTAEMGSLAQSKGRDPEIAEAMANPDVKIEGLSSEGAVLTLSAAQAKEVGYADYIADNLDAVVDLMIEDPMFNLSDSVTVGEHESGIAERISRFASGSVTGPMLLAIGIVGLVLEMFTVGFGIAGIIGVCSLCLYFGGRMLGGISGWEAVLCFLLGIIAMLIEILVTPGFGVAGIAGIVLLVLSIIMTSISVTQALQSVTLAIVLSFVLIIIMVKVFGKKNRFLTRVVLFNQQSNTEGYQAAKEELKLFEGMDGVALTTLRPAGTAKINGERVDVVTSGEYIEKDTEIKVIKVEGTRVVVAEK